MHQIDDDSPLYKYSKEEIRNLDAHLYILINYHEESFSQKVYQINSYHFEDLITDVKYKSAASFDVEGYTLLDHNKLSKVENL